MKLFLLIIAEKNPTDRPDRKTTVWDEGTWDETRKPSKDEAGDDYPRSSAVRNRIDLDRLSKQRSCT